MVLCAAFICACSHVPVQPEFAASEIGETRDRVLASEATFVSAMHTLGLPEQMPASQAGVFDFNADDVPDLYFVDELATGSSTIRVFLSEGGNHFKELSVHGLTMPVRSTLKFARGLVVRGRISRAGRGS